MTIGTQFSGNKAEITPEKLILPAPIYIYFLFKEYHARPENSVRAIKKTKAETAIEIAPPMAARSGTNSILSSKLTDNALKVASIDKNDFLFIKSPTKVTSEMM